MRTQPRRPSIESPVNATTPDTWRRRIRRAAHAALLACNIAFASVVAAQDQPALRPTDALAGAAAAPDETHRPAESTPPAAPAPTAKLGSPGQRPTLPFDFDADGVPDTIRREMRLDPGELLFSRFVIVSGATGLDLDAFPAPEPNDLFGWLVTNVGDLDSDNVPDLAVAAPRTHTGVPGDGIRGRVFILSGATHDTLLTIDGDWWGFSGLGLVVVDDQDGDGVLDLLIGGMQRIVEIDPGDGPAPDGDGALFGDPPTDEPVVYFHSTWSLHSVGAGEVLESGEGAPPVRFLLAGESLQALWNSGPITGPRLWLEGASGDLNADGVVDMQDLLRLVEALGDPERAAALSHYFQIGDLNGDGAVNMSDLTALLAQYGRTAQDLARERAERAGAATTPRPTGSGAASGDCTDEFGEVGGGCYITCVDCPFDIGIPGSGGGPPCPLCPPNCPSCIHCPDCADPPEDCTTQCACYACSCDQNGNGVPDKNDDDDGDGILNKNDCDSSCYTGGPCGCGSISFRADANNDGAIDDADEALLSGPAGLIVLANTFDSDVDGWPDFADGFNCLGEATQIEDSCDECKFHRLEISICTGVAAGEEAPQLSISYSGSQPQSLVLEHSNPLFLQTGQFRLWRRAGDQARNPAPARDGGDYVEPGYYEMQELGLPYSGGKLVLWLEGLHESQQVGSDQIAVSLIGSQSASGQIYVTGTRMELVAREGSSAAWRVVDALIGTTLDDPANSMPAGTPPGLQLSYQVRVYDPRPSGIVGVLVAGQPLPLQGQAGLYQSPEFACVPPQSEWPSGAQPPNMPTVTIEQDGPATIAYNPSAQVLTKKQAKAIEAAFAVIGPTVDQIIQDLKASGWPNGQSGDPGAFGKAVHDRATIQLHGQNRWLMNVYVDNATNRIRWIGPGPANGFAIAATTQIDAAYSVIGNYQPQVGDVWDPSRCKIFEIKTGVANATTDQAIRLGELDMHGEFHYVRGRERYRPGVGFETNSRWKAASVVLGGIGIALTVHAFVSTEYQDQQIDELANLLTQMKVNHPHNEPLVAILKAEYILKANAFVSGFFPEGGDAASLVTTKMAEIALTNW